MIIPRETIYAALWSLVSTTPGFATTNRRMLPIGDQLAANLPSLAMIQSREQPQETRRGVPAIWKLSPMLVVYASAVGAQRDASAMPIINPLIDALEARLAPDRPVQAPTQLTLGGLVSQARIVDTVEFFEGLTSGVQAVSMTLAITVP